MRPPISIFKDGEIHALQTDGSYKVDWLGSWSWRLGLDLHHRPEELRTQQDRDSLKAITEAFRARKEYEEDIDGL